MSLNINITGDGSWITTVASDQQRYTGLGPFGGGTIELYINPDLYTEIGDAASPDWVQVTSEDQTAEFARNLDFGKHRQFKVVMTGSTSPDVWLKLGSKTNNNS